MTLASGSRRVSAAAHRRTGRSVVRIPWDDWRRLAKAVKKASAGISKFRWWRMQAAPPVAFPYRRWRQVRAERLRRIRRADSVIAARCECGHPETFHVGTIGLKPIYPDPASRDWKLVKVSGDEHSCQGCGCEAFRESKEPAARREMGDDLDALVENPPEEIDFQVSDGARQWTRVPPAWRELTPTEEDRLANSRRRALECRTGKALELEHIPCGTHWWVRFGCRTRLCATCGDRYRGLKRNRFEPLARLHFEDVAEEDRHPWIKESEPVDVNSSALKFLTLTFPDNVFVGPKPEGHEPAKNEIRWETPNDCREWFRAWTKKLRHFIGPWKAGKKEPSAPASWGVKGYLAVWEVTAEKVCGECGLGRSKHIRLSSGRLGPGIPGGRDKAGNLVRDNDCSGWKNERRSGRFHPHLHLLVWARFIPIEDIRKRWKEIGGGGQIRLEAAEGKDAVDYILKYLGKPWSGVPDDLQVVGLYRMRRVTSCGEFYGKKFTELTANVLEGCEKTRAGIYCQTCLERERAGREERPLDVEQEVESLPGFTFEVKDGVVSEPSDTIVTRRLGAWTTRGVEIKDLRKLGKPEKGPPEWATVKLRMLPDFADSSPAEAAHFAVFAWNGVMTSLLPDKLLHDKVFTMPKETWAQVFALEDERLAAQRAKDEVPF